MYDVTFTCDGSSGTARLTIAGGRPDDPTHQCRCHPDRGVHAGEGGTLAGFDLKEIGLGRRADRGVARGRRTTSPAAAPTRTPA